MEKKYLKAMFISIVAVGIFSVGTLIYFLYKAFAQEESFANNGFELAYLFIHLLIVAVAAGFSFSSIKRGAYIMPKLMYRAKNEKAVSIPARVIAIVIATFFTGLFTYALLILINNNIYDFNFPLCLKLDLLDVSLFVIIVSLYFLFYPIVHNYSLNKSQ